MEGLKDYLDYLKIEKNLSLNTIIVYERDLLEFDKFLGKTSFNKLTRNRIRGFLAFLTDKNNQPITRRRKLTSIRNFFQFLQDEGLIENNPVKNIPIPKVQIKEPSCLTDGEVKKLLEVTRKSKSKYQKRNELIVKILVETGIRLSELTNLDVGDFDKQAMTLRVRRKGGNEQNLPINSKLCGLIKKQTERKKNNQPIIQSNRRKRITQRRIGLLVKKYFQLAGITKRNISVHSLRHSFCSRLLEKGVDIKTIQILAGHRSISTTERYLHIAKSKLRKEVRLAQIN